jgi:mannose-6-phosphate isomerase-like protein (cupin superfamily)
MNDAVSTEKPQTLAIATTENPIYVAGRRDFFKYRELGVTEATHGRMRAQITESNKGLSEPTGWHYHVCEQQFIYMLKGWVDLEFEDGRKVRLKQGDSMMIPGGMRHNETATSEEMDILEISVPSKFGTVPVDAPAGV